MPNLTAPTANDRAAAARLAGLPANAAQLVGVAAAALPQRQTAQAENALRTALAMLLGARVVDCRRDPLESCFSCFRTLFIQGTQAFSYDLDDLAAYWYDYDRVSRYWATLYPRNFREQQYEALVDDPEAQTRALLDPLRARLACKPVPTG